MGRPATLKAIIASGVDRPLRLPVHLVIAAAEVLADGHQFEVRTRLNKGALFGEIRGPISVIIDNRPSRCDSSERGLLAYLHRRRGTTYSGSAKATTASPSLAPNR
jgi:hypothetical protein